MLLFSPAFARGASTDSVDLRPFAVVLDTTRCQGDAVAVAALPARCFLPLAAVHEPESTTYFHRDHEWVRVRLPAAVADGRPWIARISWRVDSGDLTVVSPAGRVVQHTAIGMQIPTADRPIQMYDDRIPLHGVAGGDTMVLEVTAQRAVFGVLEVWAEDALLAQDASDDRTFFTPLAFINGMLLAMALFNLLLFAQLRQRSYLLYSLAMLAMIGFQTIQSGVAWTLWWPHWHMRDDAAAYISYLVYFGLVTAFTRSFLDLRKTSPVADVVLLSAYVLLVLDAVCYVGFPGALYNSGLWELLDPVAVLVMIVALLGAGIVATLRGVNSARFYVIGFGGAAIGIFLSEAADYGLLASNRWNDLWSVMGVAWESVFLAFALADRIRAAEREAARLTEFAYLDQLTGVPNRRAFDEALDREWRRGTRTGRPLSLLIFDIDHFKAYNDTYGHQAGDEALRLVATEIARSARRPGDFAARYGGEEFAIVLAETPREGAIAAAEAVRLAVRALDILHSEERLTISVGCATLVPYENDGAAILISFADGALYAAKAAGRDRTIAAAPDRSYRTSGETPPDDAGVASGN